LGINVKIHKVCPVVLRSSEGVREILVFRHPVAGVQLVKGSIESGETPQNAALRELAEESGITSVTSVLEKGKWDCGFENQRWHFFLCQVGEKLKDSWTFYTNDGGGLNFKFFWHNLRRSVNGLIAQSPKHI
jgi:8-oxo-dGTP pyrophosphatase MutT (NUDIX family)